MYSAMDIATYIICTYWNNGRTITNLKLQKVLYYIQGYSLSRCGVPAFYEEIYRWSYGPVVPKVYYEYSSHRARPISKLARDLSIITIRSLRSETKMTDILDCVIKKSFELTDKELVELSCEKMDKIRVGAQIPIDTILKVFVGCDPIGANQC